MEEYLKVCRHYATAPGCHLDIRNPQVSVSIVGQHELNALSVATTGGPTWNGPGGRFDKYRNEESGSPRRHFTEMHPIGKFDEGIPHHSETNTDNPPLIRVQRHDRWHGYEVSGGRQHVHVERVRPCKGVLWITAVVVPPLYSSKTPIGESEVRDRVTGLI